jgi:hypothetical protein
MILTPLGQENARIQMSARARSLERLMIGLVFVGMAAFTVLICYLQMVVFK